MPEQFLLDLQVCAVLRLSLRSPLRPFPMHRSIRNRLTGVNSDLLHYASMAPDYYSTEEAARKLGITRAALHLWIKKGQVTAPKDKIGRALVWTDADIRRLKAAHRKIRKRKGGRPRKRKPRK